MNSPHLFRCPDCRTMFYTDDGLARHICPGKDFEVCPIGTLAKLRRLERENSRLRTAFESIKIMLTDIEDPIRRLGPGWVENESDGRSSDG